MDDYRYSKSPTLKLQYQTTSSTTANSTMTSSTNATSTDLTTKTSCPSPLLSTFSPRPRIFCSVLLPLLAPQDMLHLALTCRRLWEMADPVGYWRHRNNLPHATNQNASLKSSHGSNAGTHFSTIAVVQILWGRLLASQEPEEAVQIKRKLQEIDEYGLDSFEAFTQIVGDCHNWITSLRELLLFGQKDVQQLNSQDAFTYTRINSIFLKEEYIGYAALNTQYGYNQWMQCRTLMQNSQVRRPALYININFGFSIKVRIGSVKLDHSRKSEDGRYLYDVFIYHGVSGAKFNVQPGTIKYLYVYARQSGTDKYVEVPHGEDLEDLEFFEEQSLDSLSRQPGHIFMQKMFTLDLTQFVKQQMRSQSSRNKSKSFFDFQIHFQTSTGGQGYVVEGISLIQQTEHEKTVDGQMLYQLPPVSEENIKAQVIYQNILPNFPSTFFIKSKCSGQLYLTMDSTGLVYAAGYNPHFSNQIWTYDNDLNAIRCMVTESKTLQVLAIQPNYQRGNSAQELDTLVVRPIPSNCTKNDLSTALSASNLIPSLIITQQGQLMESKSQLVATIPIQNISLKQSGDQVTNEIFKNAIKHFQRETSASNQHPVVMYSRLPGQYQGQEWSIDLVQS